MFTPDNVELMIKQWEIVGGYVHWKDQFGNWQRWCKNALGIDRSNVSDAVNERAIIERFAKPERYMKYRKMGLKELQEEGNGWDQFLMKRMIAERKTNITIKEPTTGKLLTAKLPAKLANAVQQQQMQEMQDLSDSDSQESNDDESDSDVHSNNRCFAFRLKPLRMP